MKFRYLILIIIIIPTFSFAQLNNWDERINSGFCNLKDSLANTNEKVLCFKDANNYLDSLLNIYQTTLSEKLNNQNSKDSLVQSIYIWKIDIDNYSIETARKNPNYDFEMIKLVYINESYRRKIIELHRILNPTKGCGYYNPTK